MQELEERQYADEFFDGLNSEVVVGGKGILGIEWLNVVGLEYHNTKYFNRF